MQPTKVLGTIPINNIPVQAPIDTTKYSVSLSNPQSIETFGDNFGSTLSTVSEVLQTSETKLKNMGEVGKTITSLLTTAKSLDPNDLLAEPSFLDRIFYSTEKNITKFIEKQKSVSEVIKATSQRLIHDCDELIVENNRLQQAYDTITTTVMQMVEMIAAGQQIHQQFVLELSNIKTEAEKHEEGYLQVQNYSQRVDRFAQKLDSLIRAKAIVARQLVQIKIMQNTNITEVDTIRDVVTTAIPIWETNIGLGISALKTRQAIDNRQNVTNAINSTLQRNAELMQQNTQQAIEGSTSSTFSLETIKASQDSLINSINLIQNASELGKQKRAEAFLQITAMDNELKQTLLK